MALHLLVTVNQNRQIVHEIDFRLLLKLSQQQCLIMDHTVLEYIGNRLPDRLLIAVGHGHPVIDVDHVEDNVEGAIQRYKESGLRDAIAVGFSRQFNKRMLEQADVLHHHTLDCQEETPYSYFPMLSECRWDNIRTEHIGAKPLCRSVGIVKRCFKRREL